MNAALIQLSVHSFIIAKKSHGTVLRSVGRNELYETIARLSLGFHYLFHFLCIYVLYCTSLFQPNTDAGKVRQLAALCGRNAINQPGIKRAHTQHLMNHHTGRFPNRSVVEYRLL